MKCIDYRNARYQGDTHLHRPHGVGIAIDINHLFCLAHWKQGRVNGPFFVVYPDGKILCGHMHDNHLSSLCCFYLADDIKTYINYRKTDQ